MRRYHNRNYPKQIQPCLEYHRIPSHSKLKRLMVVRLMRHAEMPDKCFIDKDTMCVYMKEQEFFGGMSVSLLFRFKKRDVKWWVDNNLVKDWDYVSPAPDIPSSSLTYHENQGYFGFCIKDIEGIRSTYPVYDDKGKVQRTDNLRCEVVHAPSNVNFWHYNIFLVGEQTMEDKSIRKYYLHQEYKQKKVGHIASNVMEDFYTIMKTKNELRTHSIPRGFYKKGKKWTEIRELLIQSGKIRHSDIGY